MPNWVANRITIKGSAEELAKFNEHIAKKPQFNKDDKWDENCFSFHSFITPDDSVSVEEYQGDNGIVNGERVGDTPNNWYQWNTNYWDTKWDACEVEIVRSPIGITINFQTAWDKPLPVFQAMVEQFPNLEFSIWWEEEQGFGGEFEGINGNLVATNQWDIPSSHQDYVNRDDEDGCVCRWNSDTDDWYADCPRDEEFEPYSVTIEIVNSYSVHVSKPLSFDIGGEFFARQVVSDYEDGFDNEDGITVVPSYSVRAAVITNKEKEVN
jgi:hypothetical protein